jgi:hypothetical protein
VRAPLVSRITVRLGGALAIRLYYISAKDAMESSGNPLRCDFNA